MSISRRDFLKIAGLSAGTAFLPTLKVAAKRQPGDQVAMLYDSTKCIGCNACTNACRQWNNTTYETDQRNVYDAPTELSAKTWTMIQLYQGDKDYAFVKRQCMHCIDPACVSGCPVSALQKSDEGPVTYDPDRCIGCRYCMYTCPFHIPRFQWDEVIPVVAKCTFCHDRIIDGKGPACAERCPTGALIWGTRKDLLAEAENRVSNDNHRYLDHIYGKDEAGGTSVLYLSAVPFEKLGLEDVGNTPVPDLSEATAKVVLPGIVLGGPFILGLIRLVSDRGGWEESWPV